jgi:class 3 adenylate cyclase/ligand-binding sensor domain-containing protein
MAGRPLPAVALAALVAARPAAGATPLSQYVAESWTQDDGLPANSVFAMAQGPDGYLWLGVTGLVRFDGVRFTEIDRSRLAGRSAEAIDHVLVSRSGALWLYLRGGSLVRAGDPPLRLELDESWEAGSGFVSEDREGRIWVGNGRSAPFTVTGDRLVPHVLPDGRTPAPARGMVETPDGARWIATDRELLRVQGREVRRVDVAPCGDAIDSIHHDGSGHVWLAMSGAGLCGHVDEPATSWVHLSQREGLTGVARVLVADREGSLWIGTDTGLLRYAGGKLESPLPRLRGSRVYAVLEDQERGLLVGTGGHGLVRLRRSSFVTFGVEEGLSDEGVWSFTQRSDGAVLVGTNHGAVNVVDAQGHVQVLRGPADRYLPVGAMLPRRDGSLLVGDREGLFVVEGGVSRPATVDPPVPIGPVRGFLEEPDGRLWVATTTGLFVVTDRGASVFDFGDGRRQHMVMGVVRDHDGTLWAPTKAGLAEIKGATTVLHAASDGVPENLMVARLDSRGTLWLGSAGNGLARFRHGKASVIDRRRGLFDDSIWQILDDEQGRLWMSSDRGVWWARTEDLDAVLDGRAARVTCRAYGRADGLRTREFNGGMATSGIRAADGRLWWPTIRGVAVVDPAHLEVNTRPPAVVIEEVTAHERVLEARPLHVPAGGRQLSIAYSAPSFVEPRQIRFRYRLDGFDRDWVDAGARRVAFYTGLAPGSYVFRVIAQNSDQVWGQEGAALPLTIEPFFWQTLWFRVLLGLAAFASLVAAYQARVMRLRARQRELESLVDARTRELGAEKEKTDRLLLNILPASVAARLKADDAAIADRFDAVTVLFSDIVGFTDLSSQVSPEELVGLLNDVFSRFDNLADKHGTEKIKTIGDAYMVVAGVPTARADHAPAIARMALEMLDEIQRVNAARGTALQVRIGINSGPVVAGVIGKKRFSYDLWGDAVNMASRMESHGLPGRIHITASTRDLVVGAFSVERRGEIEVKGKGKLCTYWLTAARDEA